MARSFSMPAPWLFFASHQTTPCFNATCVNVFFYCIGASLMKKIGNKDKLEEYLDWKAKTSKNYLVAKLALLWPTAPNRSPPSKIQRFSKLALHKNRIETFYIFFIPIPALTVLYIIGAQKMAKLWLAIFQLGDTRCSALCLDSAIYSWFYFHSCLTTLYRRGENNTFGCHGTRTRVSKYRKPMLDPIHHGNPFIY